MRYFLIVIAVYTGLFLVFTIVRHNQLANTIQARVALSVQETIAAKPVDHLYTLFTGILVEQIRNSSPNVANNESSASARYELIAMSPCNPRIQRCS